MKLNEAGIIEMWVQNELLKSQIKARNARLNNPDANTYARGQGALTLGHLQGAFFLAGIGVLLAAMVLLLEIISSKFIF